MRARPGHDAFRTTHAMSSLLIVSAWRADAPSHACFRGVTVTDQPASDDSEPGMPATTDEPVDERLDDGRRTRHDLGRPMQVGGLACGEGRTRDAVRDQTNPLK